MDLELTIWNLCARRERDGPKDAAAAPPPAIASS
jgi:hypothetical protein